MNEVVLVHKAEPVGKLVKQRKGVKSVLGVPEQHKRELSSGSQAFKPAISLKWLEDLEAVAAGFVAAIVLLDAAAALFVGVPWAMAAPATVPAFWSVYGLAQAAWAVPGLLLVPTVRGRRRNFKALVDWMTARYGLRLGAKQGLSNFISQLSHEAHSHTFTDANGQALWLGGSSEKGYLVWRDDEEYPQTSAAKAVSVKRQVARSLPTSLQEQHTEVQQLIAKLNQRDLSPESDHVVNRAERDIEKVLTLYGDLQELNVVTEANVEDIRQVLTQLRTELTDVFQREAQWALDALKIETTYVKAREARPGFKINK